MKTLAPSNCIATLAVMIAILALTAGCAPSVKVRSDVDPGVNMGDYQSYNFFSELGIEAESSAGLMGQHFRNAIAQQMEARGYVKSDSPQLQINVTAATDDKVRVNTYSDPYLYGGYYGGYRRHYDPWGGYGGGTRTTVHQYTEANIYIDMVDSGQHKMVWQGVANFTLTDKMQKDVSGAIQNTVTQIFGAYPVPAPGQE